MSYKRLTPSLHTARKLLTYMMKSCLPEHICALFASVTGENFPKSTARSFIMPANTI